MSPNRDDVEYLATETSHFSLGKLISSVFKYRQSRRLLKLVGTAASAAAAFWFWRQVLAPDESKAKDPSRSAT